MESGLSLQIENNFAAINPASEKMRAHLASCGAPGEATFLADLIVEELVTNTIKYGYDDDARHFIDVTVDFQEGRLSIEIRDDGHEFNPLLQESPDTTLSAEERQIGGLGIHLVREMTDDVRYERRGHENVVIATKTFPPNPSAC